MLAYSDVIHPGKRTPTLSSEDGSIIFEGNLSGGQLAFAKIAQVIVEINIA